jgi:MerR family transcriptional regulator, light-induced transcriptional regulator
VDRESQPDVVRIGELSRRVGVSDHVLRAWETRYGLLAPVRSPGGFRLYSDADERQVRRMQFHLSQGLSAAEAARSAISEAQARVEPGSFTLGSDGPGRLELHECARLLQRALDQFDEGAAQAVLDRLLSDFTLATTLRDVVLPYLQQLGERWELGEISIAQEHYASHVIRGRLAGLARGWGDGTGPRAILACPPDELHDLPLLIFGIVLNRNGWRVDYFGASTPVGELVGAAVRSRPDLIVLAATTTARFKGLLSELSQLAAVAPLALAGAGATQQMADEIGARLLSDDPVSAAQRQGHGW